MKFGKKLKSKILMLWILNTTLLIFTLVSCELTSNNKSGTKQEEFLVKYIQSDTLDKSLNNIRLLKEVGSYFGNTNYSLDSPYDGYLSSKIDSSTKIMAFTFNPKIDFDQVENFGYLREDKEKGALTDYQIVFNVDENNKIISKKSFLTYTKSGAIEFENDDVPSLLIMLNDKLISEQKKIHDEEKLNELEKQKLVEKLNEMDNSDFWNEFDIMVKERVYNLVQEKDCNGLQAEFNTAEENLKRKHNAGQTANKQLELMDFLDKKLKEIGCYE